MLSVNPAGKKVFFELCETLSFKPLTVAKRTTLLHPASGEFSYPFDQLGIDRMAAMEAFLAFLSPAERSPERLGVVVSAGTATTVDFVTTGGIHVGGVILPGLDFSLRCLHEKTGLLPRIYPQAARIRPGSSTSTALSQGVLAMTLGAVRELRRSLAPRFPLNDQCGGAGEGGVWGAGDLVVVTGGWGEMLSVQDPQWIWRPHLALCGGRFMVLSGG